MFVIVQLVSDEFSDGFDTVFGLVIDGQDVLVVAFEDGPAGLAELLILLSSLLED